MGYKVAELLCFQKVKAGFLCEIRLFNWVWLVLSFKYLF